MTANTTETKNERLILNFTVQERHELKELHLKSHSVSESDFVRRAVELYVTLHRLVVAGSEIVLRHEGERRQVRLPIPKVWNREAMPIPDRETPRRNFELKIEPSTKEAMTRMVEAGAAPSVARLAWAAIGTYATVLERQETGFVLMAEKNGKFTIVAEPRSRSGLTVEPAQSSYPSASGFEPGKIINIYDALQWEKCVKADVIWFVAPVQTPKRFPSLNTQLKDSMMSRFLELTKYIWLLDDDVKDAEELSQWLYETFNGILKLSDYTGDALAKLNDRIAQLQPNLQELARDCPVFALVKIATRTHNGTNTYNFIEAAKRIKTYWLAELRDGSIEGQSFIGATDHAGENPDGAQLMGMAGPDAVMILDDLKKAPTRLSDVPVPNNYKNPATNAKGKQNVKK